LQAGVEFKLEEAVVLTEEVTLQKALVFWNFKAVQGILDVMSAC
jgi:hypothetical protein